MAIFKVNKSNNFTIIDNSIFKNKELSLKAIGLLCKMLSLPPEWDFSLAGLVAISKENETAVRSALKELQQVGYLEITKIYPDKSSSGRIEYIYNVYETKNKKQEGDFLGLENQGVENQRQLSTKQSNRILSKDNILNKKNIRIDETSTNTSLEKNTTKSLEQLQETYIISRKVSNNPIVEEVIFYLNKITGKKYRVDTPETIKLITSRLKDGYTVEDMKKVIEHRWHIWKGTDMEQYVRPSTLFRPSKFEGYLNSLGTKKSSAYNCPDNTSHHQVAKSFDQYEEKEKKQTLSGVNF